MRWQDLYIMEKGESEGYVNFKFLVETLPYPFIFMIGARGIGKTYGANEYLYDNNVKSLWMRRTQTQCDVVASQSFFHGKELLEKRDSIYKCETLVKNFYQIYKDCEKDDDGKILTTSDPYMYCGALSTLHNVRGAGEQYIEMIVYDEFIPEEISRKIKGEGKGLLSIYETYARNRELTGKSALKMICMANSDNINNDVFAYCNMIGAVSKQFKKGKNIYTDSERGYCVINFTNSPISTKKKDTALYKFASGTDYGNMALNNEFTNYMSPQRSYPLKSLQACMRIGEITICRVKGSDIFYVTTHKMETKSIIRNNEKDLMKFKKTEIYGGLVGLYLTEQLFFEDYESEYLFKKYLQFKA